MGINLRLRDERERLGLSQQQLGEACGVRKQAQHMYESGARKPDSDYLYAASLAGINVLYVLTGNTESSKSDLDTTETLLLSMFRKCSDEVKLHVLQNLMLVSSGSAASPKKESVDQKNKGNNSVQVGIASGDVNINSKTKKNKQ